MKIRGVVLVALTIVSGCSSLPYSLDRPTTDRFASLSMVSAPTSEAWKRFPGNGIHAIDGHTFSSSVESTVYVLEGRHIIGYLCPGWIAVDAGAKITFDFNAGASYVLDCNGAPNIHVASKPK
jgi:hypothetical protein